MPTMWNVDVENWVFVLWNTPCEVPHYLHHHLSG